MRPVAATKSQLPNAADDCSKKHPIFAVDPPVRVLRVSVSYAAKRGIDAPGKRTGRRAVASKNVGHLPSNRVGHARDGARL